MKMFKDGPAKELSELEKTLTAVAAKGSSVTYKGTYAPENRKFHYVIMFETDSYALTAHPVPIIKLILFFVFPFVAP